jgi:prepilin-type N-terminal cleavage/methylation domain-containing protein
MKKNYQLLLLVLNKGKKMRSVNSKKSEQGFTLMEVMIAMVIFLVVTGAIYGLLRAGNLDRNRSSRRTDTLKNARAALQLIGRDAVNAGLGYTVHGAYVKDDFLSSQLGFRADIDDERDLLTAVISGNSINLSDLQANRTDMIGFATRDVDFSNGLTMSITDSQPSSTNSSVPRLTTADENLVNSQVNDLYVVEANGIRTAVMTTAIPNGGSGEAIEFALSDPLGMNLSLTDTNANRISLLRKCAPPTITTNCMNMPGTMKRFFLVTYKVKQDGTLVRTRYGNVAGNAAAQVQEQPLAYGVEDMQIRYILRDGTSSDDPSMVGGVYTPANLTNVRMIIVVLTVRDDSLDENTRLAHKITLDGTFSTRNLEYDIN